MADLKGYHAWRRKGEIPPRHSYLSSKAVKVTQMSGRTLDIALACFYVTIPLTLLTGIFLALIYRHRVTYADGPFPNLPVVNTELGPAAYYVNLSSTFVIFIASWMSSLAPVLVSFVITLAAYRIGEEILDDTREARRDNLCTPYQLSLVLRFVNGATWSGLWFWLLYMLGWARQRQPQAKSLRHIILITTFTTLLGLAVFGADTWLHISTETVNFVRVSDITSSTHAFSLGLLSPNCTATNNSIIAIAATDYNCGFDVNTGVLVDASEPIRTLNNISNTITVNSNAPDSGLEFLGIAESVRDLTYDFAATTYGMLTSCRPITQECNLKDAGNMTYNCGNGSFQGAVRATVAGASFKLGQFANQDLSEPAILGYGVRNPYYTTLAAIVDSPSDQQVALSQDPEIVTANGGIAFVLLCTSTMYDIRYDLVDNQIIHLEKTLSNSSVTNIWASIMAQTIFGISNLDTAVTAGVQFSQTAQQVADSFASALSKVSLSAGVQGLVRVAAPQVQQRHSVLVAKIPQGPLFALVAANLSFIFLGAFLAVLAWTAPSEAREVQTRLSITGLVADRFEGSSARVGVSNIENMFDEYQGIDGVRIGIDRSEQGGYVFKIIGKMNEPSQWSYGCTKLRRWENVAVNGGREGWI